MSFFSCTHHKNYFYFLVFWISELFISITNNYLYNALYKDIDHLTNEYIDLICLNLADLLAGFLVIYTKCSFQKKESKRLLSKAEIKLIYNNPTSKKNKIILLFLISFLDFISRSCYFWSYLLINNINKNKINIKILEKYKMDYINAIDILMRYFFSQIILKTKLYNHHFFAILISSFGFILMSILDFISILKNDNNNDNNNKNRIVYILVILPRAFLFPLEDVINKILLSDDFLLPHSLMYDRGFIEFIIIFMISIILFLTDELEFNADIKCVIFVLIKLGYIIISFIKAFCLMEVIYIFTSQYVSFLVVSESVAGTLILFTNIILDSNYNGIYKNIIYIIVEIVALIMIIFGTLMYNEMIVINKWGLNENTKRGLYIKGQKDYNSANNQESLDEDDSSDYMNKSDENNDSDNIEKNNDKNNLNSDSNSNSNYISNNKNSEISLELKDPNNN